MTNISCWMRDSMSTAQINLAPYILALFTAVLTAIVTIMLSTHAAYGDTQESVVVNTIKVEEHTKRLEEVEVALKDMQPVVIEATSTIRRMEKDVEKILIILRKDT